MPGLPQPRPTAPSLPGIRGCRPGRQNPAFMGAPCPARAGSSETQSKLGEEDVVPQVDSLLLIDLVGELENDGWIKVIIYANSVLVTIDGNIDRRIECSEVE